MYKTSSCNVLGEFKEAYELGSFPFDVQDLTVRMSFSRDEAACSFASPWKGAPPLWGAHSIMNCNDHLENLGEWSSPKVETLDFVPPPLHFSGITILYVLLRFSAFGPFQLKLEIDGKLLTFSLCVAREWNAYIWRIFAVLSLVTATTLPVPFIVCVG
jgi:hypothetical protein